MVFYDSPRSGITARIPSINRKHNQKARSLYDSSFSVLAPRLWNMIPKATKERSSLFNFKLHLDTFLKTFPDRPPVAGYMCQNNNSLLDWNITARATF